MYSKRTLLLFFCASIAVGAETPLLQWEGRSNRQDTLLWISDATEKLLINSKGYPFSRIELVASLNHIGLSAQTNMKSSARWLRGEQ